MAKTKKVAKVDQPVEAAPAPIITSIKGFRHDLSCRDHKFEIGQTYAVEGPIKACSRGWHACPDEHHPLSVFNYYPPVVDHKPARYCVVEQSGDLDADGTKLASAKITIGVEITISDLVQRAVKWVKDRVAPTQGYYAHAVTQGKNAIAAAIGRAGRAKATFGAIVLAYYDDNGGLQHIAAAKVGDAIAGVTVQPDVWYRLTADGTIEVVE